MQALRSSGAAGVKWSRTDALWVVAFAAAIFATKIGQLAEERNTNDNIFTLMAAHVLDGHLPFIHFFDVKPPMIYWLLAGAMALFGEHFFVVRLVGYLSLLASCIVVFAIARLWSSRTSAGLAALLLVAVHANWHAFGTLPGIPGAAMIMAALWLLAAHRDRLPAALLAGLLLSLAVLTRTNLGVAAVVLGAWLLAACFRPALGVRPQAVGCFAAGGLLPLVALVLLYWEADALVSLRIAMIDVPWNYANQNSYVRSASANAWHFHHFNYRYPFSFLPFTGLLLVGVAATLGGRWRQRQRNERALRELAWLALVGFALSIVAIAAEQPARYYLLQLFPIMAVFCALGLEWMRSQARLRLLPFALVAVAVGGALAETLPRTFRLVGDPGYLASRWVSKSAAAALAPNLHPNDTIYAFDHSLIHWYSGTWPVTPILHPGMARQSVMRPLAALGVVAEDELQRVLDLRPTYLVLGAKGSDDHPVRSVPPAKAKVVGRVVADHYRLFYDQGTDVARIRIYRSRDAALESPKTEANGGPPIVAVPRGPAGA